MTSGLPAIDRTMSASSTPAVETPRKTSAPTSASRSVVTGRSVANSRLTELRSVRRVVTTPRLSHIVIWSRRAPSARNILAQAMAAAPAPLTTICASSMRFPLRCIALMSAAEAMIAVPCWSSCMTGMSSSSTSRRSISKHSGAFMSSRLIPPKVGAIRLTAAMNSSGSVVSISMSKALIPEKCLKSMHLPSMTGLAASGPMSPSPSTAVPLVMTATRLPLIV